MLRSMRDLLGCSVLAEDGESGVLHDLYFDDQIWIVRYFVVQLGEEGSTRKALIPPGAFRKPDEKRGWLPAEGGNGFFARRSLEMSPDSIMEIVGGEGLDTPAEAETSTVNLQSGRAVSGYQFQAQDGQVGQIEDFIVNDETWGIYYLVVDTGCWRPGQKTLISPFSLLEINRAKGRVLVNLNWEVIQNGPRYERSRSSEAQYQARPYRRYTWLRREQRHTLPI